jgi:glycosyltransferase involved in cell wall biosynthesis
MKILHVISTVDARDGGPQEAIRQLACAHARMGHVTEIVGLDDPEHFDASDVPATAHILGPSHSHYAYSPRLLPWLRANRHKYDAVVMNGLWQYATYATWAALHNTSTPYFIFPHGMLDPWFKHTYPLKHAKKWLFWPWADYRALRDAAAVLFTCEQERVLARESFWLYQCNEVVVNFGTGAPAGDPDAQRALFYQRFPELAGRRILLFLGRIQEKKGCDLLIDAYAQVARQYPAVQLVMAGPDQVGWQSKLMARARQLNIDERITWTGMLAGDYKWGAYRAAEAFVLPSHQENFGIVVTEALACGVPVLISDKVNIWQEVVNDGAGLVANDDLAGTVSLLQRWLQMPAAERARLSVNARRCFINRFEIGRAAAAMIDALTVHVKDARLAA